MAGYIKTSETELLTVNRIRPISDSATAIQITKADGEYEIDNKEKQLDHSKLHNYLKSGENSRDMSATISCQNEVIKYLLKKVEELENKIFIGK